MSAQSNNNGRAYEYACLTTLCNSIGKVRKAQIIDNSSLHAAKRAWDTLQPGVQSLYRLSAESIVATVFALEPRILENCGDVLNLYIQTDDKGKLGDVRDIIVERSGLKWEIGLSIKHNHMAVKHSRISEHLDFGKSWYGVKCSDEYWNSVAPTFKYLRDEKAKNTKFKDLPDKDNDVYIPLLNAFMAEISKQVTSHKNIPRKLVEYLLSKFDFYKIISIDHLRLTTVQSFNMYGTLNLAGEQSVPQIKIPRLSLPTKLLHIGFKPKKKTTVLMAFDNGWQFSFRIHNAETKVVPSLKFDIQIEGMPTDVNMKFNCKWRNESN